jgi:4-amino-4-deoxy-L-arabinose transferase-like glycosyltransferase
VPAVPLALVIVLAVALWLRLPGLTAERFHEDEAIYSAWALQSATGIDPGFDRIGIDKPPVYLTLLALAFRLGGPSEATARWPNVIAGLLIVALTYRLGTQLYDRPTGLLAAVLVALSPFAISFGPTAFTDPWMVVLVLVALDAAAQGLAEYAGLAAGLATMTKPTAPLFWPLILAFLLLLASDRTRMSGDHAETWWPVVRHFLLALGIVIALVLAWDASRHRRPGFLFYGAEGYGGLALARPANWLGRLKGWLTWMSYFTASPVLNLAAGVGISGLLLWGTRRRADRRLVADRLIAGFLLLYLLSQWVFTFHVWDRYLLGLVPLAALLLARAVLWPLDDLAIRRALSRRSAMAYPLAVTVILAAAMIPQATQAAAGHYPIGGDHGAYQGIDQVASYLRQNAPPDSIIFHYRLRRHFAYYLFGAPFDFRWYSTPNSLAAQAQAVPDRPRYTVIPSWRDARPLADALVAKELRWEPVFRAHRRDGTISFTIYQITGPAGP